MAFLDFIEKQPIESPVEIFPFVIAVGVERGRFPLGRDALPVGLEEVPVRWNLAQPLALLRRVVAGLGAKQHAAGDIHRLGTV